MSLGPKTGFLTLNLGASRQRVEEGKATEARLPKGSRKALAV